MPSTRLMQKQQKAHEKATAIFRELVNNADLLAAIFQHLPSFEDVASAALTCSSWHEVVSAHKEALLESCYHQEYEVRASRQPPVLLCASTAQSWLRAALRSRIGCLGSTTASASAGSRATCSRATSVHPRRRSTLRLSST